MSRVDRGLFLEVSTSEADAGQKVGRDPRQVPLAEMRRLEHPESPIKAIRAKCVDCSGNNQAEVRKCTAVFCPLWPFRMGTNIFHAASASSKSEAGFSASGKENGPAEAATSPSLEPTVNLGKDR